MGSSAPKTESVVKGGKPVVVREYLSPEYLTKLTQMASSYGERALNERSTYQEMVNRQRASYGQSPLFEPMQTTAGQIIEPFKVSEPYDASGLVQAAQESGMFKMPKQDTGGNNEKEKTQRNAYNDALKMTQPRIKNNPKFNSGQY